MNCQDLIILSNSLCNVIYIKERYCLASFLQEQHSCTCLVDTAGNLQHLGLWVYIAPLSFFPLNFGFRLTIFQSFAYYFYNRSAIDTVTVTSYYVAMRIMSEWALALSKSRVVNAEILQHVFVVEDIACNRCSIGMRNRRNILIF